MTPSPLPASDETPGASLEQLEWLADHARLAVDELRDAVREGRLITHGHRDPLVMAHHALDALLAALRQSSTPPTKAADGASLIAAERQRQMAVEGWTPSHDDDHIEGELRDAAIAYAMVCDSRAGEQAGFDVFPATWSAEWWKPSEDPIRNLVKAGALIAAEIDRLHRAASPTKAEQRTGDNPV